MKVCYRRRVMVEKRPSRRALLAGLGAVLAASALPGAVEARGRGVYGGRLAFRVPWSLTRLDPHDVTSFAAALFAPACFDTLFARDEAGAIVPSLAEHEPEASGADVVVTVREGLKSARSRPVGAKEAAASLSRARAAGLGGFLADVAPPRVEGNRLRFSSKDPAKIAKALASPLAAIVPFGFTPDAPDGTGPFRATFRGGQLVLARNPLAARGPAYLDEIVVSRADDLKASLRAFETAADDLGWLGMGLYEPRPGAKPFDAGALGYVGFFVGRDAGSWDAPGIAQRVCDSIPPARLAGFSLGAPWTVDSSDGWGGPSGPLLVRDDSPYLVELARAVAGVLSRPDHELTVKPVPAEELAQKRASRMFCVALDVVRPVAAGALGAMLGLVQAADAGRARELGLHPPKLGEVPVRSLTRTLRVGVLGELRAQGGRMPDVVLPNGALEWGAVRRARRA